MSWCCAVCGSELSGRPGDLVVCVDDSPCVYSGREMPIRRGSVHIVHDLFQYDVPFFPPGLWFCAIAAEVRGIYAPPELHAAIKEFARKLSRRATKPPEAPGSV